MFQELKKFLSEENGAITVDWVVMTAAIVVLGVAVGTSVSTATADRGDEISDKVVANVNASL